MTNFEIFSHDRSTNFEVLLRFSPRLRTLKIFLSRSVEEFHGFPQLNVEFHDSCPPSPPNQLVKFTSFYLPTTDWQISQHFPCTDWRKSCGVFFFSRQIDEFYDFFFLLQFGKFCSFFLSTNCQKSQGFFPQLINEFHYLSDDLLKNFAFFFLPATNWFQPNFTIFSFYRLANFAVLPCDRLAKIVDSFSHLFDEFPIFFLQRVKEFREFFPGLIDKF